MVSNTGQRVPPQFASASPRERAGSKTAVSVSKSHNNDRICKDFSRLGKCQYGEKCKFLHEPVQVPVSVLTSVKAQTPSLNNARKHGGPYDLEGEKRPQSESQNPSSSNVKKAFASQPCHDWMNGKCKFGDRCQYLHEGASPGHAIKDKVAHTKKTNHSSNDRQTRLAEAATRKRDADAKVRLAKEAEKEKRRLATEEAARAREAERLQAEREATQRQKARAKEETLRFEKEAAVTSQHVVLGSTLVTFAAGLEVKSLVSGFESCRLTIRNIPSDAKPQEITDLFTQQGMSQHDVHILSIGRTDDGHLEARVLTSAAQGGVCAAGLDGIQFRDETLEFEVGDIVSPSAMGESNNRRADTLTITWFAPSATMIATYPSMDIARQKQKLLNGKIVGGRRIKAEMNRPPLGAALRYYNPNSVKIMGIPMDIPVFDISDMAGTLSVQAIKSNIYDLQELLRDLRQHLFSLPGIRITSFDRDIDKDFKGTVTIKVRFENWEDANTARASLEGKRLRSDYPTFRLHLPPPLHFTSTIPIQQYQAQQRLWDSLASTSSDKGPWVYINCPPAREVTTIRLSGDDKKLVGALKVRVETLVAGEKLDATYWHRSFLRPQGREFLARVFSSTKVYVRGDFKTRSLKIYGEGKAKERARQMIEDEVTRLELQEWTVFLKRQSVGYFVRKGLAALKEMLGEDAVSLDLASSPCKLTIRGGEEARHALSNLMDQSLNDLDLGSFDPANDMCPICYDGVSNPLVLGCKHVYCTPCIRHYITSASEAKIFPLTCMGNEAKCKVPISIPVIQRFLSPQQFEDLINVAFSTYLDQHPREFRYCTTPDCTQIYRANTKALLKCPSCFAEESPAKTGGPKKPNRKNN
ncbi:hypothetical protein C0995_007299 [Termitomyces sp. Mi166|nr:hypothetical protein C0995_007299 [Termitomyces sp. Mi166\